MRSIEAAGLRVSRIGLGTWQFGSREWGYGERYAREVSPALVRRAVELGISLIDTAEIYGFGRSERIVGAALAELGRAADGLVVATKFMPIVPGERIVARQAAGSLRRLGVDALDLYYVHWPNPFVSSRRVMQSLRPLVAAGLVRRVAVSNHRLDAWRAAERTLRAPVVANQVRFSLVDPAPARTLVPWAAANDRLVVAYSPLGQGFLAGTTPERPRDARAMSPWFRPAAQARLAPLLGLLREVARAHGATPAQVALAWVLHHPNTVAIPGARTIEQLEENAAAADLTLSDGEFVRLSAAAEAAASPWSR